MPNGVLHQDAAGWSFRAGRSFGPFPCPGIQSPTSFMPACAVSAARAGCGRGPTLMWALASLSRRLSKRQGHNDIGDLIAHSAECRHLEAASGTARQ
jgi:hypothetical protein